MIDFKTEIQKYKPVLEIDKTDSEPGEVKDIMDMLQYITQKVTTITKE
ncbi:MAG: hypothetical protein LBT44_05150 [Clostridiales bacterium]|jgi:hypothetical protein|nr:hypothetical protein [Clostridiales bacterium]